MLTNDTKFLPLKNQQSHLSSCWFSTACPIMWIMFLLKALVSISNFFLFVWKTSLMSPILNIYINIWCWNYFLLLVQDSISNIHSTVLERQLEFKNKHHLKNQDLLLFCAVQTFSYYYIHSKGYNSISFLGCKKRMQEEEAKVSSFQYVQKGSHRPSLISSKHL